VGHFRKCNPFGMRGAVKAENSLRCLRARRDGGGGVNPKIAYPAPIKWPRVRTTKI
jgi:hypothetical protein